MCVSGADPAWACLQANMALDLSGPGKPGLKKTHISLLGDTALEIFSIPAFIAGAKKKVTGEHEGPFHRVLFYCVPVMH